MGKEVNDDELKSFIQWYKERPLWEWSFGITVLETCMCGHFHTYTKVAVELRKRCCSLGLIRTHRDGTFEILI